MPLGGFNPRPREGGDDVQDHVDYAFMEVSIHAPAKEATYALDNNFNPYKVSIHAPAKEATSFKEENIGQGEVSIHAPAKEATRFGLQRRPPYARFNPRPREGGDNRLNPKFLSGAFQSTPPRRRRLVKCLNFICILWFQSTPPRRRRLVLVRCPLPYNSFNPRPREGSDLRT